VASFLRTTASAYRTQDAYRRSARETESHSVPVADDDGGDDAVVWQEVTAAAALQPGAKARVVCVVQMDVTEQKRLMRLLEAEHHLLESIFPRWAYIAQPDSDGYYLRLGVAVSDLGARQDAYFGVLWIKICPILGQRVILKKNCAGRHIMEYVTLGDQVDRKMGLGGIMKNPKLKDRARSVATLHPNVTVLFADIVGEFCGFSEVSLIVWLHSMQNAREGYGEGGRLGSSHPTNPNHPTMWWW
jgi:hypothetical protein